MKIVYVANNPFPYHTPILNELNALVDLHVIYMSPGHPLDSFDDIWGVAPTYSNETYWSVPIRSISTDFRTQVSLGISRRLRRLKPDVLLVVSWGPLVVEPLLWARATDRGAVMWAESTQFSGLLRNRISDLARRAIISLPHAFVAISKSARRYLIDLGARPQDIVTSCLPSPLQPVADAQDPKDVAAGASPAFLFVGRLIPRKRPDELLRAFGAVVAQIPRATLTIVGDGPLRDRIVAEAAEMGEAVKVLPRLEGEHLSAIYASADILVVPSVREVWGLVVNEALAHGLFVIATDQVGSALDLLDSASGTVIPAEKHDALVTAMVGAARTARRDPSTRAIRSARVENCRPELFARDIFQAAELAFRRSA
jgi:glycosyltransferase involved in cell wall biosynthesis